MLSSSFRFSTVLVLFGVVASFPPSGRAEELPGAPAPLAPQAYGERTFIDDVPPPPPLREEPTAERAVRSALAERGALTIATVGTVTFAAGVAFLLLGPSCETCDPNRVDRAMLGLVIGGGTLSFAGSLAAGLSAIATSVRLGRLGLESKLGLALGALACEFVGGPFLTIALLWPHSARSFQVLERQGSHVTWSLAPRIVASEGLYGLTMQGRF